MAVATQDYIKSFRVQREEFTVECPPKRAYPLEFLGVRMCGDYPGYQGKGIRRRCMLEFAIVDAYGEGQDFGWAGTKVSWWVTPTLDNEKANAYKLAKAIDPSFELEYEWVETPKANRETGEVELDEDGNPIMIKVKDYDFVEQIMRLVGKPFYCTVDANHKGYPELAGEPYEYVRVTRPKRRPSVTATVVEPEDNFA